MFYLISISILLRCLLGGMFLAVLLAIPLGFLWKDHALRILLGAASVGMIGGLVIYLKGNKDTRRLIPPGEAEARLEGREDELARLRDLWEEGDEIVYFRSCSNSWANQCGGEWLELSKGGQNVLRIFLSRN